MGAAPASEMQVGLAVGSKRFSPSLQQDLKSQTSALTSPPSAYHSILHYPWCIYSLLCPLGQKIFFQQHHH